MDEKSRLDPERLATRLDNILYDWDPYSYHDDIDSREEGLEIARQVLADDPGHLKRMLADMISEMDEDDELYEDIKEMQRDINDYMDANKSAPKSPIATDIQEPTSASELSL